MIGMILKSVGIGFGGAGLVALGLIASQHPNGGGAGKTLDFSGVQTGALLSDPQDVIMRDGYALQVRHIPANTGPLVVMVHGSSWNGLQFDGLARSLQAEILIPDLRGHGAKPGRRGDVDHIGQLEEDLADLISAKTKEGQKVVLLGHSSGGGLVVRMAGGAYANQIDAAVLLAPFLKYNAPTTRVQVGGWARALTRRIIGLSMLNGVGIRALNHLKVIEFNMPKSVLDGPYGDLATLSYSYRLNTSYAPRMDYMSDIAALPSFLLIAGAEDEAFAADQYEPLMSVATNQGAYRIVPDTNHLGVVDAPATAAAISEFLNDL